MALATMTEPRVVYDEITLRVPRVRYEVVEGERVLATFGGRADVPTQEELDRTAGEMQVAALRFPEYALEDERMLGGIPAEDREKCRKAFKAALKRERHGVA